MRTSTADVVSLLVIVALTISLSCCYPYAIHQQRKADPFVALANTLRQEQEQEALQEQQQQQQRLDSGYYYDYGREEGPSDDDLYQMAQFQRQLSRAAVAPFFGRAQRSGGNWGNVALDDGQFGYPVESEDTGSEWYDAPMEADRYVDDDEEVVKEEEQRQEGQLLLDMLTEYMLAYGQQQEPAAEERKRGSENATTEAVTTTITTTSTAMTTEVQQPHHPEKQPPVRKDQNGTPLGQQEFPMMRPATPQRNQWLAATHMLQNQNHQNNQDNNSNNNARAMGLDAGNKKRHYKGKNLTKKSSIVTPEDELIEELDNLKMKKN